MQRKRGKVSEKEKYRVIYGNFYRNDRVSRGT